MKRFFIISTLWCLCITTAFAQEGLNINQMFTAPNPAKTETYISGKKLKSVNLKIFHSISLPNNPTNAKAALSAIQKDSHNIVDKEVVYRNGQIKYGIYTFTKCDGNNRYLFYINKDDRIKLIYMEGKASKMDIKRLSTKN